MEKDPYPKHPSHLVVPMDNMELYPIHSHKYPFHPTTPLEGNGQMGLSQIPISLKLLISSVHFILLYY